MTDLVRLLKESPTGKDRLTLSHVDSAFSGPNGVHVEFEEETEEYGRSNYFEDFELVGFGR